MATFDPLLGGAVTRTPKNAIQYASESRARQLSNQRSQFELRDLKDKASERKRTEQDRLDRDNAKKNDVELTLKLAQLANMDEGARISALEGLATSDESNSDLWNNILKSPNPDTLGNLSSASNARTLSIHGVDVGKAFQDRADSEQKSNEIKQKRNLLDNANFAFNILNIPINANTDSDTTDEFISSELKKAIESGNEEKVNMLNQYSNATPGDRISMAKSFLQANEFDTESKRGGAPGKEIQIADLLFGPEDTDAKKTWLKDYVKNEDSQTDKSRAFSDLKKYKTNNPNATEDQLYNLRTQLDIPTAADESRSAKEKSAATTAGKLEAEQPEKAAQVKKEANALAASLEKTHSIAQNVLKEQMKGGYGGFMQAILGNFGFGTEGYSFEKSLDNLKSRLAIDTIKELKQLSATGATGFGALSEKELDLLLSAIENLDSKKQEDDVTDSLENVVNHYGRLVGSLHRDRLARERPNMPPEAISYELNRKYGLSKADADSLAGGDASDYPDLVKFRANSELDHRDFGDYSYETLDYLYNNANIEDFNPEQQGKLAEIFKSVGLYK